MNLKCSRLKLSTSKHFFKPWSPSFSSFPTDSRELRAETVSLHPAEALEETAAERERKFPLSLRREPHRAEDSKEKGPIPSGPPSGELASASPAQSLQRQKMILCFVQTSWGWDGVQIRAFGLECSGDQEHRDILQGAGVRKGPAPPGPSSHRTSHCTVPRAHTPLSNAVRTVLLPVDSRAQKCPEQVRPVTRRSLQLFPHSPTLAPQEEEEIRPRDSGVSERGGRTPDPVLRLEMSMATGGFSPQPPS